MAIPKPTAAPAVHAPFDDHRTAAGDELCDELRRRSPRHWTLVQAISRRRDVLLKRVRVMLTILRRACPLRCEPRVRWYVQGALVAASPDELARLVAEDFGESELTGRTIATHLRTLERAGAIVRSPGAVIRGARAWNKPPPRLPDTIHVLYTERESDWWAHVGSTRLEEHPEARLSARAWMELFPRWRVEANDPQLRFDFELGESDPSRDDREESAAKTKADATALAFAANSGDAVEMLRACARAGAYLHGTSTQLRVTHHIGCFAAAIRELARELARGRRIRNRAGWLMWAFNRAREVSRG